MAASETNTYAWYVDPWYSRTYTYENRATAKETSDDLEVSLYMAVLPSLSGVLIPPDWTLTAGGNYFISGCEISLRTAPDQIMYRLAPLTTRTLTDSESSVSTKTLIPPAVLPKPSTNNGDAQTASAADATDSISSSSSGSGSSDTATQSGSNIQSTVTGSGGNSGRPSLGGGAIAGIVIGAILVLALIIGGWFFWRRRQRAKESALGSGDDEQARRERDAVLPAAQNSPQEKQTCHHPEHYYEMPGSEQAPAQELDPRDSAVSAMNGARHSTSKAGYNYEPTYELNPESRPGELPHGENEQASPVLHQNQEPASTTAGNEMTEASDAAVSPNVEAQRRREMEWLEMEEERIRKRRETLAMQGGGKG